MAIKQKRNESDVEFLSRLAAVLGRKGGMVCSARKTAAARRRYFEGKTGLYKPSGGRK